MPPLSNRPVPVSLPVARGAWPRCFLAFVALMASGAAATPPGPLSFNRDIKPLLSDHCYACHGPDPGSRKAGLRLDTRSGLFEGTDKRRPAVVAGRPDDSELWTRVITTDVDDLMPPPDSHKELSAAQKDLLRRWIAEGARWQPHWSFLPPERPPIPEVRQSGFPIRNPIDALVLARLQARQLAPAPEADRRTLVRRVTLDLTGLPPTPEEVDGFVGDRSADAYERLVRRLLSSPAWGEHRARYWLDAARYADTHGLHFDNYREMWPYRDWVIRAFNQNLPFDQFTRDQLAGDLLPDPTDDQLIATGFQRCNATTNEGGTIEEENQANYAVDRVTTAGWVWLGLTVNCASCHDHKFDPLTMRDFYSLAAFFRNTTQSGFDGNVKDGANAHLVVIEDPAERARWQALPREIEGARAAVEKIRQEASAPFEAWAAAWRPTDLERDLNTGLVMRVPLDDGTGTAIRIFTNGLSATAPVEGTAPWAMAGRAGAGSAVRFEGGGQINLGGAGDYDLGQPFSYGAWVRVPTNLTENASLLARMDEAQEHRGWDLWVQKEQFAAHFVSRWPADALKVRTRKSVVRRGEWQHVLVTTDGSGRPDGVRLYVDGKSAELDTEGPSQVRGSLRTSTPLRLGRRSQGAAFEGGSLQDFRLYSRVLAAPDALALARFEAWRQRLTTPLAEWKAETREEMLEYFLVRYVPYQDARRLLAARQTEREAIRIRNPVTHIQREKTNTPPMAAILFRGQYDRPGEKVAAGTPAVLHAFPSGAPTNRLGLAQWIVSPANPLTGRVTVNRFWQEVFGVGLVKTAEDFGITGEAPANPELLDWLATEFVASGWDVKHLFTLMVTSSAYRQSAATTPEKLDQDPGNRFLSRGPRFRLDAEMVRDAALAASGLLERRVGGPSVKPYQPSGVWEAVAMPESDTREYRRDTGAALYRRSLYTFWKRSAPPALLDVFNAPSRESCTVRRERTNTPLQALATLNDPAFIEAARRLAERVLARHADPAAALDDLARRILARPLQPDELREVSATLDAMRAFYEQQPQEAAKLVAVGESAPVPDLPAPRLAAFTLVANQLFNLDEALTK